MKINAARINELIDEMERIERLPLDAPERNEVDTNVIVWELYSMGIRCRIERVNERTVTYDWSDEFGVIRSYDIQRYG